VVDLAAAAEAGAIKFERDQKPFSYTKILKSERAGSYEPAFFFGSELYFSPKDFGVRFPDRRLSGRQFTKSRVSPVRVRRAYGKKQPCI
jgi:hypothetical protein